MEKLFSSLRRFIANRQGGMAPFVVLVLSGMGLMGAYAVDASRMMTSAAQVKRATDAAALAVGQLKLADYRTSSEKMVSLAKEYIQENLGMDSELRKSIDIDSVEVNKGKNSQTNGTTYDVSVEFRAEAVLLGRARKNVRVSSTVEVFSRPTEIALVLPNTLMEKAKDIAALQRIGKEFTHQLIGEREGEKQGNLWLSIVPYSQAVNVYDASDPDRIRRWAKPGALNPVELTSLFSGGGVASLADRRVPDRRAKLLCMFRGLRQGENYFWDQSPVGQFGVYYRHDLPENGSPGAQPISWYGPNPMFGDATGDNDTRWMVADKGCPSAPLLPLTDDLAKIDERLSQMSTRFNVNYAIAMGWAAAALSPNMRGGAGWGDSKLPLDFNEDDDEEGNVKAIVMLANTAGDWFDTDSYNYNLRGAINGDGRQDAKSRLINLCNTFRARKLKFYFIGVRPGDPDEFGRKLFDQVAGEGIKICTGGKENFMFANADNFVDAEDQIQERMNKISDDIKSKGSYVRLVQ